VIFIDAIHVKRVADLVVRRGVGWSTAAMLIMVLVF
jgi:hypothetical protein